MLSPQKGSAMFPVDVLINIPVNIPLMHVKQRHIDYNPKKDYTMSMEKIIENEVGPSVLRLTT